MKDMEKVRKQARVATNRNYEDIGEAGRLNLEIEALNNVRVKLYSDNQSLCVQYFGDGKYLEGNYIIEQIRKVESDLETRICNEIVAKNRELNLILDNK